MASLRIPVGEAYDSIPVGDAMEIPHIPVGDATELRQPPPVQSLRQGASPEATAFRQANSAPGAPGFQGPPAPGIQPNITTPPAAPTSVRAALAQNLRSAGTAAVKGALPGAIGYLGATALRGDTTPQPGRAPDPTTGAGVIPGQAPGYEAPPAQPEPQPLGFGGDNEVTRNISNTLNATLGLPAGALGATLRAGGAALRGIQGADVAANTLRGAQISGAAPASLPSLPNASLPTGVANAATPGAQTADPSIGPQLPTAPPENQILRSGSSFSGSNITPGFSYSDGSPSGGQNGPAGLRAGVTTVPGFTPSASPAPAGQDPFGPGATGGGAADLGGSGPLVTARNEDQYQRDRANYLADQAIRMNPRRGAEQANAILGAEAQRQNANAGVQTARLREAGESTRAMARDRKSVV